VETTADSRMRKSTGVCRRMRRLYCQPGRVACEFSVARVVEGRSPASRPGANFARRWARHQGRSTL